MAARLLLYPGESSDLVTVSGWVHNQGMANKEKRYKVKGRIVADYEIVVQALNADEAAYFANDIDIDKWREVSTDWKITEVTRNYFLKVVKEKDSINLNDVSHRE
jgi:hypothetical protein